MKRLVLIEFYGAYHTKYRCTNYNRAPGIAHFDRQRYFKDSLYIYYDTLVFSKGLDNL